MDNSPAMLALCREKVQGFENVQLVETNICQLKADRRFDLVIAPFRVLQNLAPGPEVVAFLKLIRRSLQPAGIAILNAFNPFGPRAEVLAKWQAMREPQRVWRRRLEAGWLEKVDAVESFDARTMTFYPVLTYVYTIAQYCAR